MSDGFQAISTKDQWAAVLNLIPSCYPRYLWYEAVSFPKTGRRIPVTQPGPGWDIVKAMPVSRSLLPPARLCWDPGALTTTRYQSADLHRRNHRSYSRLRQSSRWQTRKTGHLKFCKAHRQCHWQICKPNRASRRGTIASSNQQECNRSTRPSGRALLKEELNEMGEGTACVH